MVADDDAPVLHLLTRCLSLLQHRVVGSAANGRAAVALAHQHEPDLVILDIDMPGLTGVEAARMILETRKVPIIISTGRTDEPTLRRLRNLQIGAYLVKPFSPAQLKAAIFVAMAGRRLSFEPPEASAA